MKSFAKNGDVEVHESTGPSAGIVIISVAAMICATIVLVSLWSPEVLVALVRTAGNK